MRIYFKHKLSKRYRSLLKWNGINTPLRLAHFFGQCQHESNLKPRTESLNYSVGGLLKTFRKRISVEEANRYGRKNGQKANQKAIANIVYGGNWGARNLGNTQQGDGWRFRGRGIKQITGRANYRALTKWVQEELGLDVDYIENPDLLLREADSMIAAIWYWKVNNCNYFADKDDVLSVSRIVNLGNARTKATPNGYMDRKKKTNYYKKIFE